jgi:anti-sigma factor RsiW
MTCHQAARWLQLYADGRLDAGHFAHLERHLAGCPQCRREHMLLELICQAAVGDDLVREPAGLTEGILWRIASVEARRLEAATAVVASVPTRDFTPDWGDGVLASFLATVATVVFLYFQPALRAMAGRACLEMLGQVERGVGDAIVGSSSWVAWAVWVIAGLCLAIWFAGGEVRAGWRRALTEWRLH